MRKEYLYLSEELIKKNIRPSQQRLKILEYFYVYKNHPTVENIYDSLKQSMPTLSKATIYNTLKTFVQHSLVNEVLIEENEARYDLNSASHGHFKCKKCGKIYDFQININEIPAAGLEQFEVDSKDVYFKGICRECVIEINN